MSWETDNITKTPCKCGMGFLVSESRSDDWGRTSTKEWYDCDECERERLKNNKR